MDRDDQNNSGIDAGRHEVLFHYLRIIAAVAAAVVLVMLIWYFMKPAHSRVKRVESAETVSITAAPKRENAAPGNTSQTASTQVQQAYAPQNLDGTGEAGVMEVTDGRTASSGISGWQICDQGKWYEVGDNMCYYGGWKEISGKTFYFDQQGFAAIGWTKLSYQYGCYFDADGVYMPDRDKSKVIALTFDDGPTDYTDAILDVLAANGAKATFFLLGANIDGRGEVLAKMASLGMMIGNHTFNDPDLMYASADEIDREFSATDELIAEYTDLEQAEVVRFPYNSYTRDGVVVTGRSNILFDCETYDLETDDPNQIVANVNAQLQGGIVIRMHDCKEAVVEALQILLPGLISQGYEFVTIEDLAASRGYDLIPGATYLGFKQSDLDAKMVNDQ